MVDQDSQGVNRVCDSSDTVKCVLAVDLFISARLEMEPTVHCRILGQSWVFFRKKNSQERQAVCLIEMTVKSPYAHKA
ncbi:MAG: hypothetical protein C5B49_15270 [Bdellovibrio sp.]|nr:MAG: hypothetical protein C5B49_15270 [Bdellovibrio sp.]